MRRIGMLFMVMFAMLLFAAVSYAGSGKLGMTGDIVGMEVRNSGGSEIGEIAEVIKDQKTGHISLVVLSKEAGQRFTVPFAAFEAIEGAQALTLTVDENLLANAPEREAGMTDAEFGRTLQEYYGLAPAWGEKEAPKAAPAEKTSPRMNY